MVRPERRLCLFAHRRDRQLVVVNTVLASVAGAVAAMLTLYAKRMKPDPTMMCNGLLAGLVAVSASCGLVGAGWRPSSAPWPACWWC